jgi:hypothetical protein
MPLLRQLFQHRRRDRDAELDTAIAGVQLGLDEKRQRWMHFLIEKLELHRRQAQAQTPVEPGSGDATILLPSSAPNPVHSQEERGDG